MRAAAAGLPPGPRLPRIAQTFAWTYLLPSLLERSRARFGDTFTVRLAGFPPIVVFSHPDAIKEIFTGDPAVLHAGKGNQLLEPILGRHSVLLLDEKPHLAQRRLLLPPFHGERMAAYARVMADATDGAIDGWPVGRPFALHPSMQAITLEVILRAVFGMREGPEMRELADLVVEVFTPPPAPMAMLVFLDVMRRDLPLSPWRKFLRLRERLDRHLFALIDRRRREADAAERDDVLALLLAARHEDGQPMSDAELRDELVTMIAAGHETTATALSWAFERLTATPAAMARLDGEVQAAGGAALDPARARELPFLDAVIKETLRLRPIVPIVARELQREATIGGFRLPAGVVAAPCIYLAQRRESEWPEPEQFRPERFVGAKVDPYSWLPFGGGVRRCIGMAFAQVEMGIVLQRVVARTRLEAASGPSRMVRRSVTLAPSDGARVVLRERASRADAA
jgi:cytochrome P450